MPRTSASKSGHKTRRTPTPHTKHSKSSKTSKSHRQHKPRKGGYHQTRQVDPPSDYQPPLSGGGEGEYDMKYGGSPDYDEKPRYNRPGWYWRNRYGNRFSFSNGLYYFKGPSGWRAYAARDLTPNIIAFELGVSPVEAASFYASLSNSGGEYDEKYGGEGDNSMGEAIRNCAFPFRSGGEMVATAVATQTALPLSLVPDDMKQGGVVTTVPASTPATSATTAAAAAASTSASASDTKVSLGGGGCEDERYGGACFRQGSAESEYAAKMAKINRYELSPREYLKKLLAVQGELSFGCYTMLSYATKQRHHDMIAEAKQAAGIYNDRQGGDDERLGAAYSGRGYSGRGFTPSASSSGRGWSGRRPSSSSSGRSWSGRGGPSSSYSRDRGWGGRDWGYWRGRWGSYGRYGRGWRVWSPRGYVLFDGIPTLAMLMAINGLAWDYNTSCAWLIANGYPCQ